LKCKGEPKGACPWAQKRGLNTLQESKTVRKMGNWGLGTKKESLGKLQLALGG